MKIGTVQLDHADIAGVHVHLPIVLSMDTEDAGRVHVVMGFASSKTESLVASLLTHWLKHQFQSSFVEDRHGYELACEAFYDKVVAYFAKSACFVAAFVTIDGWPGDSAGTMNTNADALRQFMHGGRLVRWKQSGQAHARIDTARQTAMVFLDGMPGAVRLAPDTGQLTRLRKNQTRVASAWYGFGRANTEPAEIIEQFRRRFLLPIHPAREHPAHV